MAKGGVTPPSTTTALTAARVTWGAVRGTRLSPDERRLVEAGLGGVVLFTNNVAGASQLRSLTSSLREAAGRPIHVSMDEEGGHIRRLGALATPFPPAMAIGATRSARLAFEAARATARELAALGVDVVHAPVVDLALDPWNPTLGARAFGSSPPLVGRLGAAATRGYLAGGVIPTPKHFPGHGRTPVDTHLAPAVVGGDREELERLDLVPFELAIEAGAEVLMVSHVTYAGLGDDMPATLSGRVMRDLTRRGLGFDGVLLTDALVMGAIAEETGEAAVRSLAAGADIVMALEAQSGVVSAVEAAIGDGRLRPSSLARSMARIGRLGASIPAGVLAPRPLEEREVEAHARLAVEIARRSLTVAWGEDLLPIRPSTSAVLVEIRGTPATPVESPSEQPASLLSAAVARRLPRLRTFVVRPGDGTAIAAARDAVEGAELAIVATRDAFAARPSGLDERDVVATLVPRRGVLARIALRSPTDLVLPPRPDLAIAAYADVPATIEALAAALLAGRSAFPGRLPVTLPGPADEEEAA
jgi:beta-N-acetylhexosaminidase